MPSNAFAIVAKQVTNAWEFRVPPSNPQTSDFHLLPVLPPLFLCHFLRRAACGLCFTTTAAIHNAVKQMAWLNDHTDQVVSGGWDAMVKVWDIRAQHTCVAEAEQPDKVSSAKEKKTPR